MYLWGNGDGYVEVKNMSNWPPLVWFKNEDEEDLGKNSRKTLYITPVNTLQYAYNFWNANFEKSVNLFFWYVYILILCKFLCIYFRQGRIFPEVRF